MEYDWLRRVITAATAIVIIIIIVVVFVVVAVDVDVVVVVEVQLGEGYFIFELNEPFPIEYSVKYFPPPS